MDQDAARQQHNQSQAETFDQLADVFSKPVSAEVQRRLARIVAAAAPRPGESILDVATGTGVLIPHILPYRPARIEACDLSPAMLAHAKEKFGHFVSFHQQDVIDLPGQVKPVDVVFCNSAFANVFDQYQALQAMSRLLRPGGRLTISHSEGRDFLKRLRKSHPGMVAHSFPEPEDAPYLLEQAGLEFLTLTDEPTLYILVGKKPS